MTDYRWPNYTTTAQTPAETRKRDVRLVASKWSRLTADDMAVLECTDDLVALLVARYGLETAQARKVVDAAMRASPQ